MPKEQALRAVVSYVPGSSAQVWTASRIVILRGDVGIATAQLGGRYSAEQALAEYRRQPGRFARLLWVRPSKPAQEGEANHNRPSTERGEADKTKGRSKP
jgi:hypothetical protein